MFSDANVPKGVALYKNGSHCTCRNDPIVLGNKRVYVSVWCYIVIPLLIWVVDFSISTWKLLILTIILSWEPLLAEI